MTENETWKDVIGFEGFYKVSDKGNVRSVARKDSIGRKRKGLTLKARPDTTTYLQVTLCKNGERKHKYIHRLVASAFIPNPKGFLEINHKDENKSNNELSNLEWCTREYNVNHGKRNKKVSQKLSKKVKAVNVESGEVLIFSSVKEAVSKGYAHGSISSACRGAYKSGNTGKLIGDGRTYKGFRWYYEEGE